LFWLLLIAQIVIIIITIVIATSKGHSGFLAFLSGLFIPLLGSLIIVALLPDQNISYLHLHNVASSFRHEPQFHANETRITGNGSWLNMAEIELSAMAVQCLDQRSVHDLRTMNEELAAWYTQRNQSQKGVDWQFSTADTRIKPKRLYPLTKLN
jgi:hypothetical protein